jgi:hypothetical protein
LIYTLILREIPVKSYPILDRNSYFNEVEEEKKVEVEEKNRSWGKNTKVPGIFLNLSLNLNLAILKTRIAVFLKINL